MIIVRALQSGGRRLDRWLLAPAPADRLATLRILVGGFVLAYMIVNVGEFRRLALVPSSPFEPVGVASWLDGPVPAAAVWGLFALLLVSGSAFVAGLWFRVSGPTFGVATLAWASYHSSWGQMLHFEHLFTIHLLILGLAPAAAVRSLDARRAAGSRPDDSVRFGWPIRLLAIITVLTYVIAAIAKLRRSGLAWVDGSNLGNHIAYSAIRMERLAGFEPPLASFVLARSWMIAPLAIAAVTIEFVAPVALIGDRFRNVWTTAAIVFHAGTAATMMVFFPYQGLGFALLPFFRVERAAEAASAALAARKPAALLRRGNQV